MSAVTEVAWPQSRRVVNLLGRSDRAPEGGNISAESQRMMSLSRSMSDKRNSMYKGTGA